MSGDNSRPEKPLGRALDEFLRSSGLLETARENLCPVIWPEVVGSWYARFTEVTRVRDGVVYVRCDSAPRANQLQLDAPDIIRRLNERLGGDYITEIRPSSTGAPRKHIELATDDELPAPREEELEAIELDEDELERIRSAAAQIGDAEVGERIERILRQQAKLRIWQRDHGFNCCPGCGAYFRGPREYCYECEPPPPPPAPHGEDGLSPHDRD